MRSLTYLGAGLLLVGALLVVAPSGAFDSLVADRGVGVQTADDEDAYLGLEYDDELDDRTLELDSDDADDGGGCFFGLCGDYEYNDRELLTLEDNTPDGGLTIDDVSIESDNDDITGGDGLRVEHDEGLGVLKGDFRCPASGFFGSGDQESRSATVSISVIASDDEVTIELERQLEIECLED